MDSFKRFLTELNTQPKNRVFIESATRGYNVSNENHNEISASYIHFLESLPTEDIALRRAIVEAYIETHVLNEARLMRKLGNTLNKVKNAVSGIGAKKEDATDVKKFTQRVLDFIGDINNFKTNSSEYIKELVDQLALMDDDEVKKNAETIATKIQGALTNTIFNSDYVGYDESVPEKSPRLYMNNASKKAQTEVGKKVTEVLKKTFPHTSQVNGDKARALVEKWWDDNMAAEMGAYRSVFANAMFKIIKDPNAPQKTEEPEETTETDEKKDNAVAPTTPPPPKPMTDEDKKKYYEKERARKSGVQANIASASPTLGALYGMGSAITLSPEAKEKLEQKKAELKAGVKKGIGNTWNKITGRGKADDTLTPAPAPTPAQPAPQQPAPQAQPAPSQPAPQAHAQTPQTQPAPVKKAPVRKATANPPKIQPTRKPVKPKSTPTNNTSDEDEIMARMTH